MCNDSSSTSKTSSNTTQTATPVVPSWISTPDQDYAGRVSGIANTAGDGTGFVAPASPLQTQGFNTAAGLGSWQSTLNQAMGLVNTATGSTAPTYSAAGYTASPTAQVAGYTPATIAGAPTIAQTAGAGAGSANATLISSLLSGSNLGGYLNPETDQVVNTTLQGLDKTNAQDQATLAAQQGLNKSFGGSGAAIGQADLTNSQALGRAQTEATLRQQAFDKASGLATTDAGNMTGVSESNAANETQASIASAQIAASRATAQAQLQAAVLSGNQDAINTAQQKVTDAENSANQQNTALTDAAGQFNAGATNTASQANQASQLQILQNLLSGGQLLGSLGTAQQAGAVSDANTQLAAGATQRGITADQLTAPLTLAQTLQSLLGYNPAQFIGQTATGSSNSTTNTQTDPSLLSALTSLTGAYASAGTGAAGFAKAFNTPGT